MEYRNYATRRPLETAVKVVEGRTYCPVQWAQNSDGVWFSRSYSYTSPRMVAGKRYSYGYCKTDGAWTRWEVEMDSNGVRKQPPAEYRETTIKVRVPKGTKYGELW